jgi:MATE family multidrug resistance protein
MEMSACNGVGHKEHERDEESKGLLMNGNGDMVDHV